MTSDPNTPAPPVPAGDVAKLVEELRVRWQATDAPVAKKVNRLLRLSKEAATALESLSRDLAEARAALEPFAAFAGYWDGLQTPDDRKFISVGDACKLTVGDLRRARSVLSTQPKETPDVA